MGGNEHYVTVRPNPDALTHTEIFGRLVNHGGAGIAGSGPDGPTEPLLRQGHRLELALDELAKMVNQLGTSYDAESIKRANVTIETMRGHMTGLGEHAGHLAGEFDNYVATYHEVKNRMPEPVPFAAQLDAIEAHHPGLLAHVPFVAELEEENLARTREARALYRQLDHAAVTTDVATPEFSLLADSLTTNTGVVTFADATTTTTSWPGDAAVTSRPTTATPTTPAGNPPPPVTATPPPVVAAPAPTPGAGGGGRPVPTPVLPVVPRTPGLGSGGQAGPSPGMPLVPPGRASGGDRRGAGRGPGGLGPRPSGGTDGGSRPGRHDITSRGRWGLGPEGGRSGGVGTGPAADQAAATKATGARGASGGTGFGPVGPMSTNRDSDRERKRPSYLEADDPNALFGIDQLTAPPVIGAPAPRSDY